MSDLQIAFAVAGVVLVGLVYGYNVYQEWRFRNKTRESFSRNQADVLVDTPKKQVRDSAPDRLDPVILTPPDTSPSEKNPASEHPAFTEHEPSITPPPEQNMSHEIPSFIVTAPPASDVNPSEPLATPPQDLSPVAAAVSAAVTEPLNDSDQQLFIRALLDPVIDFIVELYFDIPVELSAMPSFSTSRRVQIISYTTSGITHTGRGQMAEATPGELYSRLDVGLQIIDRQGVISENELRQFCLEIQQFAREHRANVQSPSQPQQLAAARSLDAFCVEVDIMIGLNVRLRVPQDAAHIASYAEAAGLVREDDGRFYAYSDSGSVLFMLTGPDDQPILGSAIEYLTILLEVPRIAGGLEVFERALAFAQSLTRELNGILVDDNMRSLTESGLDSIRQNLEHIYSRMDDRGIVPGSMSALRLFQ